MMEKGGGGERDFLMRDVDFQFLISGQSSLVAELLLVACSLPEALLHDLLQTLNQSDPRPDPSHDPVMTPVMSCHAFMCPKLQI